MIFYDYKVVLQSLILSAATSQKANESIEEIGNY